MRRDILEELKLADFWPRQAPPPLVVTQNAPLAAAASAPENAAAASADENTAVASADENAAVASADENAAVASSAVASDTIAPDSVAPSVVAPDVAAPAAEVGGVESAPGAGTAPDGEVVLVGKMDWTALEAAVSGCQKCELWEGRKRTVFGVGAKNAEWMFVGEGPGADEDIQGEPFVGRAGLLLNEMLAALELPRESVYIANAVKCRPPQNREPRPAEMLACRAYLERQIALVAPKIIVALGRVAASHLLQSTESLGRLRQRLHDFCGVPLIATYHPAYLLRAPGEKKKSWEDLCFARRILRGE